MEVLLDYAGYVIAVFAAALIVAGIELLNDRRASDRGAVPPRRDAQASGTRGELPVRLRQRRP